MGTHAHIHVSPLVFQMGWGRAISSLRKKPEHVEDTGKPTEGTDPGMTQCPPGGTMCRHV